MRVETPAYVLRRVRWSETSLILTMYSLDYGRISGIVKGALRQPKGGNKFLGTLESFILSNFQLLRREGRELDTITDVTVLAHNFPLRTYPHAFAAAGLFTDWLLVMVDFGNEPSRPVFFLIEEVFNLLMNDTPVWPVLCGAIVKLLFYSGHGFSTDTCSICLKEIEKEEEIKWSHQSGGVVCSNCSSAGVSIKKGIVSFLSGACELKLEKLARIKLWQGGYIQCYELLKEYAQVHFERRLKLRSENVMKEILNAGQSR